MTLTGDGENVGAAAMSEMAMSEPQLAESQMADSGLADSGLTNSGLTNSGLAGQRDSDEGLDFGDEVFAALASPARRRLLGLLLHGPQPVRALAAHFEMRRPSVSEHLRVLREAGLVSENKHGRQRYYHLELARLRAVKEWLNPYEQLWREQSAPRPVVDRQNLHRLRQARLNGLR